MERATEVTQDQFFSSQLSGIPVIAILRGFTPDKAVELASQAWDSGITLVEVPIQDESGREALSAVASRAHDLGHLVGAGTVLTPSDVEFAAGVGCSFTVAPGFSESVCQRASDLSLFHLPGVATATEVAQAQAMGLLWQKAFPASELGVGWISAMRGPFPDIKFVATGGIDASNATQFLDGGALAVGVGSAFTDPELLDALTMYERKSSS
jgi:Entner-Doudoroff aldolase